MKIRKYKKRVAFFIQILLSFFMVVAGYSTLTNKGNIFDMSGYSKVDHYLLHESNK